MDTLSQSTQSVLELIAKQKRSNERLVIGIAGPPGSGKSTLAESVVASLNIQAEDEGFAALLPMDGYHLSNEILIERNLLQRKGAPETFDAQGLLSLLKRIRDRTQTIRYPVFNRELDASMQDAGEIYASTEIIVVEGNYLLLDEPVWRELYPLFDATVFLSPSLKTLEERLIKRWVDHGHSLQQATNRAKLNDLRNAEMVLRKSSEADLNLSEAEKDLISN